MSKWNYVTSLAKSINWNMGEFLFPRAEAHIKWCEPPEKVWSANRDMFLLQSEFKFLITKLIRDLHEDGCKLHVFEGRRSFKRQQYLYEQGRTRLYDYKGNKLKVVTRAPPGLSMHQYGLAVDLAFHDPNYFGVHWTWDGDYSALGEVIKKYPLLEWAGDWKHFKELPHVQLKTDYSIFDLHNRYLKFGGGVNGIKSVWSIIDEEMLSGGSER